MPLRRQFTIVFPKVVCIIFANGKDLKLFLETTRFAEHFI